MGPGQETILLPVNLILSHTKIVAHELFIQTIQFQKIIEVLEHVLSEEEIRATRELLSCLYF